MSKMRYNFSDEGKITECSPLTSQTTLHSVKTPDSTELPWVQRISVFRFLFGPARVASCWLTVLELDAPPPQVPSDLDAYTKDWRELPRSIQALHIPWQPCTERPGPIRFGRYGIRYVPTVEERAWIDLRSNKSDYMSMFTAKQRYNLNRMLKKFADQFGAGEIKWNVSQTADEVRRWFDVALKIAPRTWQGQIGSGLQALDLQGDRWIAEAEEGRVRGYLLFASETPVAYAMCSLYRKHVVYQIVGYDPDYRTWSPGTVLLLKIIEHLISEGVWDVFDLGSCTDHLQYKKHFATGSNLFARVFYFRRSSLLFPVLPHLALSKSYTTIRNIGVRLGLRPAARAVQRILLGRQAHQASE